VNRFTPTACSNIFTMVFMDAANNKPTAKPANPLDGWIEVFRAGTHTAMNGAATAFTADDLDQMVANHAVQAAPAVIGHPETNDPAVGWVDAVKREGNSLFAKFKDLNAAFVEAVQAGGYRNRSVSVSKGDTGWAMNHVGWLGAKLPAVKGMAGLYAAKADALCFEAPWDTSEYQTAGALADLADLLGGLRDQMIADKGLDAADQAISKWRIDGLRNASNRLYELAKTEAGEQPPLNPLSAYSTGDTPMSITPEQLADAVAQATAAGETKGKLDATAVFAASSDAIVQENAALKAAAAKAAIDVKLDAWTAGGKLLPAHRAGHAAFMAQLAALPVTCNFAVGDDLEVKLSPADYFSAFMDAKAPVINLRGAGTEGAGDAVDAAITDPHALADKATQFVASEKLAGRTVTLTQAIEKFSTPA
jgi:hypothetical protein